MLNHYRLKKPKAMLFTVQLDTSPTGGRELLCKLNYEALKGIYGERLVLFELARRSLRSIGSVLNAFKGHIDGLDKATIEVALRAIRSENISKVFVDGSNLGAFTKLLKIRFPQVEVITFYHNVEARFFLGSLLQQKNFRALAVLMVNYLAEKKATNYSDKIVCLSQRDSCLLRRVYGRSATHVSCMAMQDKMPANFVHSALLPSKKFALFVGGVFYANRAGISWFVDFVVPHIQIKICIVGRGFEAYRSELERDGKVEVVGEVEHLADWYRDASFVIAPIFDGSGMKTKVAEALMFGKKVVGTPEAFSGYEDVAETAGWICITSNEFVAAISCAQVLVTQTFDPNLRSLYEEKYSFDAAKLRLANILGEK
jgi:glycosyltransferase involved in cell wall biosynthesis